MASQSSGGIANTAYTSGFVDNVTFANRPNDKTDQDRRCKMTYMIKEAAPKGGPSLVATIILCLLGYSACSVYACRYRRVAVS